MVFNLIAYARLEYFDKSKLQLSRKQNDVHQNSFTNSFSYFRKSYSTKKINCIHKDQ